jgi:hypothetical protein
MNKIEEILKIFLEENPDLQGKQDQIKKVLLDMEKSNPEIKLDFNFKKSLKNKLEVQSYAKLNNTKNKKINIAKSWFFSFTKSVNNIFEKPKINFFKVFNSLFISAFVAFWMFYYLWWDLLNINNWDVKNNFYKIDIELENTDIEVQKEWKIEYREDKVEADIYKVEDEISNMQEDSNFIKKTEKHNKIKLINRQKIIIVDNSSWWGINNTNTEILDFVWDTMNKYTCDSNIKSDCNNKDEEVLGEAFSDNIIFYISNKKDENLNIEKTEFKQFCDNKKWIIKDNTCTYWKIECSLELFEKNECDL